MVTAATYQKQHYFSRRDDLQVLHDLLLYVAKLHGWYLEAWAVFSNHYHFIGHSPEGSESAQSLPVLTNQLHSESARYVNSRDGQVGRKVWHNYWETCLTFRNSYWARLSYVHQNPVRHGLVSDAKDYPWCSAAWYERITPPVMRKTIERFKSDRLKVADEYDPVLLEG